MRRPGCAPSAWCKPVSRARARRSRNSPARPPVRRLRDSSRPRSKNWPSDFRSLKFSNCWAREAWGRSTKPGSRGSIGWWRSRFCRPKSATIRRLPNASRAKPAALARLSHPNIVARLRFRPGRRAVLLRDGICRRREPAAGDQVRRHDAQRSPGDRAADLRCPAIRPRRRDRPSRHQAREHSDRQAGPSEDRRLRPGQAAGARAGRSIGSPPRTR